MLQYAGSEQGVKTMAKTQEIIKHKGPGQPVKYTPTTLLEGFNSYVEQCSTNDKLATITGICLFLDINRETFYNYKKMPQYLYTIEKIESTLEELTIQKGATIRNSPFIMFYMKNKFNYTDKQDISVTATTDLDKMSDEELAEKLKKYQNVLDLPEIDAKTVE